MPPLDECERVDELLLEAHTCRDPERAGYLRQQAVLLTLDLADAVSRRYLGRGADPDDLLQVARLALVKAVRGYRPGYGSGFAAYAVPTMAGELKRYFRDCGWAVRPPRRLQELRVELVAAEERLRHQLGHEPTAAELAVEVDVPPESVAEIRASAGGYRALSLDASGPSGRPLSDAAAHVCRELDEVDDRDALAHVLQGLTEREQLILRLRFVDERTQAEIGTVLGVSQMQVSRLLASILARLRSELEASAAA